MFEITFSSKFKPSSIFGMKEDFVFASSFEFCKKNDSINGKTKKLMLISFEDYLILEGVSFFGFHKKILGKKMIISVLFLNPKTKIKYLRSSNLCE